MTSVQSEAEPASLLALAIPFVVSRGGLALMGIVNMALVAHINAQELASFALAEGSFGRFVDVGIAFVVSALPLFANLQDQASGKLRLALWQGLAFSGLVLGLILTALSWLVPVAFPILGHAAEIHEQATAVTHIMGFSAPFGLMALATAVALEGTGNPKHVAMIILGMNVVNVVLGLRLVPEFGAVGAAWSTLIVRILLLVLLFSCLLLRDGAECLRFHALPADERRRLLSFSSSGAGAAAGLHVMGLSLTAMAVTFGVSAFGAYASCWMINLPMMLVAFGLADAIGFRARTNRRAFSKIISDLTCLIVIAGAAAIAIFFARGTIAAAWMASLESASILERVLGWGAAVLFLDSLTVGFVATLRGLGDLRWPFLVQVFTMIATPLIAAVFAFGLGSGLPMGVLGLVTGIALTSLVRTCALAWRLQRFAHSEARLESSS